MKNNEHAKKGAEIIDLSVERKNREREDEERAHAEFEAKKGELGSLDTKELTGILKRLDKALDGGDAQHTMVLHLLREVDQSDFMLGMRRWWDGRGSWTQSLLYNMHKHPMLMGALPIFKPLVSFGFLELKGMSAEEFTKMEDKELGRQKFAVKALGLILPEMRPFKPLLDVLFKLAEKQQHLAEESRRFLRAEREKDTVVEQMHAVHKIQPERTAQRKKAA